jgi:hypothetical protein
MAFSMPLGYVEGLEKKVRTEENGGLVVTSLSLNPRFTGSDPAEFNGLPFGRKENLGVACHIFTACKRTFHL